MAGAGARSIIAPTNGYRGNLARQGKTVKDHAKENRRMIRNLAREREEKEMAVEEEGRKELSKMRQFKGIKSRVFGNDTSNNQQQQQQNNMYDEYGDEYNNGGGETNRAFDDSLPIKGEVFSPRKQTNFLKKKSGVYVANEVS